MFLLYTIASAFLFALTFFFRKQAAKFLSPYIALTIELIIALVILFATLALIFFQKKELSFDRNGIIYALIAGVFLAGGLITNFLALKSGFLTKVVSIASPSQIIFGVILGLLFLNENLNTVQIVGIILSIVGIVFVSL